MLMKPITLREATTADIPFLRAMIWEAILASPTEIARLGIEQFQQLEDQYWSHWVEQPDPAFIAQDATGQPSGALTLKPNDQHVPVQSWRIGIGVAAQARGQGVGRHLIERAIAFARGQHATAVTLFVDPINVRAQALYRSTGFVVSGEHNGLIEMHVLLGEKTTR
jgi:ribosomal protein S18 acetylase RimI-like enzyme